MKKGRLILAAVLGLILVAGFGVFLVFVDPLCYFKGRFKAGDCIGDSTSGAKFRVLGKHHNIKIGCAYDLEVLNPGALDNEAQFNPFVSLAMVDIRDKPPANVEVGIKGLDELKTHQAASCQ